MKRIVLVVLVAAELFVLLCACGGAQEAPAPPAAEPSSSSAEETPSAALCMGAVSHPVHRVVQLGFMETADELGYEGHILGLKEGRMQELFDCWLQGAREYDISGAAFWVGGDSAYEFLKELHGMGIKTVALHFPHVYGETGDFIDAAVYCDWQQAVLEAGDCLVGILHERGIYSGQIGVVLPSPSPIYEDMIEFEKYMAKQYPAYEILENSYSGAFGTAAEQQAAGYIASHPDMVGVFIRSTEGAPAWARAKSETGREDVVVVAMDYTPENLDALASGGVDALLGQPLYEEGAAGMECIDRLLGVREFPLPEAEWRRKSEPYFIRRGGEGVCDINRYRDMYKRVEARFGQ